MLRFFILGCAVLFGSMSSADYPCEQRDLYSVPNSALRYLPVHDQDGAGICYAGAASTVANAYLMKHLVFSSPVVHPLYAGFLESRSYLPEYVQVTNGRSSRIEKRSDYDDTLNSGSTRNALSQISTEGFCGAADLELRLRDFKKAGNFKTTTEMLAYLDVAYRGVHEAHRHRLTRGRFKREFAPDCNTKNADTWLAINNLAGVAQTEVLRRLFTNCVRFKPPIPETKSTYGTDVQVAEHVRKSLNNAAPLAVSINCFNSFSNHPGDDPTISYVRDKRGTPYRRRKDCRHSSDGMHSLVIAGQKSIGGSCHYLLRNSWGATWRGGGASACSCETRSGQYKDDCTRKEAKTFLGCWYKRSEVLTNTNMVDSLE